MRLALSVMPEANFAAAALPLFDEGCVGALEWTFDMGWSPAGVPAWLDALLADFGDMGWLLGHGVGYSLLGATGRQDRWLERVRWEAEQRHYRWISEHVGFVGAGRFSFSAPLPAAATGEAVTLGRQRLIALREAVGCPVGVENLATCLGSDDARDQGRLLHRLLEPVDGFLVLDVHNLWCQSLNTGIILDELLAALPLHRVRELHVSGGRWSQSRGRRVRRDTHDDLVPNELLTMLPGIVDRCPSAEVVTYERLGQSLADRSTHRSFRDDVRRVAAVVAGLEPGSVDAAGEPAPPVGEPDRPDAPLGPYQADLLETLATTESGSDAIATLASLQPAWSATIERFDPALVEVAAELTSTWGRTPDDHRQPGGSGRHGSGDRDLPAR